MLFIVLTILSKKSKLKIKNVNINPTRIGIVTILKNGSNHNFLKQKFHNGEEVADIIVKSANKIKAINCPKFKFTGD